MPNFPHPVNKVLVEAEGSDYPKFLKETNLPDHPAVKLAFYYALLIAVKEDPLDDMNLQAMLEYALKYEINRLAEEMNESKK